MFYKLNHLDTGLNTALSATTSSTEPAIEKCNLIDETNNNEIPIAIEGQSGKREQVANYRDVMTKQFGVPAEKYFNAVPVRTDALQAFLDNNKSAAACRIYFTKDTTDPNNEDYELLFVPCTSEIDEETKVPFFADNLGEKENLKSFVLTAMCQRPPNCTKGATLLGENDGE